jgi:salicylate hydroxylase
MSGIRTVGVIGSGLAGLAVAVAAANASKVVHVFERQPAQPALAAHIDVVPNLLRDLVALGVGDAIVRKGFPYRDRAVLDGDGRRQFELATPRLAGDRYPAALGMVYGDLLGILREQALARGVRMHDGVAVIDADDGGAILLADGQRHRVDLAVMASGDVLPRAAGATLEPVVVESLPQQWRYSLLPRPISIDHAAWVIGARRSKLMLVPVNPQTVGVALLQPHGAVSSGDELRASLASQGALFAWLASHWKDDTPTAMRPVRTGVLAGEWHQRGVLRVGTSAHVLPPHFGQSAAQAVEDAAVLGALLRTGLDREPLLDAFMSRRGQRARQVHALTTQAARWDLRPEASTDLRALADKLAPLFAQPA